LLDRRQRPHARDDDRERLERAHQAAEALFIPKQQIGEPSVSGALPSSAQPARQPRVLAASSSAPVAHQESAAPVTAEPVTPQIPSTQFARIRTWVKYGMTVSQVAEVCGVAAGEIERILRQA
jgi:hypothetical protein